MQYYCRPLYNQVVPHAAVKATLGVTLDGRNPCNMRSAMHTLLLAAALCLAATVFGQDLLPAGHIATRSGALCDSTTCDLPLFDGGAGNCVKTFSDPKFFSTLSCCLSVSACNTCCFPDCYPHADIVFILDGSSSIFIDL